MPQIIVRDALPSDVPTILRFIRDLATFEKEPHAVVASEEDLLRDGFGHTPRFHCAIAEADGRPVGFTLWFLNYSTWRGKSGIFLEDLYVADEARGLGVGRLLLSDLAKRAVAMNAHRIDLNVLQWNPAREFYAHLGIRHLEAWLPYRLEGEGIAELANRI